MSKYAESLHVKGLTYMWPLNCVQLLLSAQTCKTSACNHKKIINNRVRYVRPLTKVAVVWDVALVCGWDSHVDLCTPWYVRTYAKQVPKLCRWQGRVFVLRGKTGHFRSHKRRKPSIIECAAQKTESRYWIFTAIEILFPSYIQHTIIAHQK